MLSVSIFSVIIYAYNILMFKRVFSATYNVILEVFIYFSLF